MTKVRTIDDKGDNTLADGETLVVSMMQMSDAAMVQRKPVAHQIVVADAPSPYLLHKPGFAQLSDAEKYDGHLTDAYKAPPPVDLNAAQTVAIAAAVTAAHTPRSVEQAHAAYASRISQAWRNP